MESAIKGLGLYIAHKSTKGACAMKYEGDQKAEGMVKRQPLEEGKISLN